MADLYEFEKSYYILYTGDIKTALSNIGINNLIILNNEIALVYTTSSFDQSIFKTIKEIKFWRGSMPMSLSGIVTNNITQGISPTFNMEIPQTIKNKYLNLTGKGVLVAIIGSGIDYKHPDFIYENKTSKIIRIWDQQNQNGSPPVGYLFGSEYTNEELNNSIKNDNLPLTTDTIGTGTMAAGIVVGLGTLNKKFIGVAPGAELIVIKLREYEDFYYKGKTQYKTTDYLAAINYALEISTKLNRPLVINATMATKGEVYGNSTVLSTVIKPNQKGRVVVYGSGNDGNTDTHYSGKFSLSGETQDILIKVGEGSENLDIYIIVKSPDKVSMSIISPVGEMTPKIDHSYSTTYEGKINIENVDYKVNYCYPEFITGDLYLSIRLMNIKPGVWTVRLYGDYITRGIYDMYLPPRYLISPNTRFLKPDPLRTLTSFSSDRNVITVGAYDTKADSIWIGSSKGEMDIEPIKPNIVAHGVNIIGSYPKESYNTITGTEASASIVSGVVALMLEYFLVRGESIESAYTEIIKTYLMAGATTKPIYKYPNVSEGYGLLNLLNTFEHIKQNL